MTLEVSGNWFGPAKCKTAILISGKQIIRKQMHKQNKTKKMCQGDCWYISIL